MSIITVNPPFAGTQIGDKTIMANQMAGLTNEAKITAAIARAVAIGALYVYVPANMLPYNASLVTFNNAVRMIAEGYNPGEWNVRAYGAAGNAVQDDTVAINQCILAARTCTLNFLRGGIVKFPAGGYLHTGTINVGLCTNDQSVVLRGDGMRTTYLYPSGPSTNFTASPLYNATLLFGSAAPDASGSTTQNTQYCGLEDMSINGSLITSGSVVGLQFTQMQKGWVRNHICEQLPNSSIGIYLRGSTVTGGLGTGTTAPHAWRNVFENVLTTIGSGLNTTPRAVVLQNADENSFVNCVHGITPGLTLAADTAFATWIQLGRNNIFLDCLQSGDRTALKSGYVGIVFGPPQNEAGVANGSVVGNTDYGAVMEGFDICAWFKGDSSGNTLGNTVVNSDPSFFTTAYRDDNPALTNGGFVGGGNGGNIYEAPMVNVMYRATAQSSQPIGLFPASATTPSIGGCDHWQTQNAAGTIITDFLAATGASLDGRTIYIRFNDANTTIRDVNNGGGGHIRNWGRQDIVGTVDSLVAYRNFNGIWFQITPVLNVTNVNSAFVLPTALRLPIAFKTANYNLAVTDHTIRGDSSAGTFSLTLPDATLHRGIVFNVKKVDTSANVITIATTSAQTIDGQASLILAVPFAEYTVQSDGTNWALVHAIPGALVDGANALAWATTIGAPDASRYDYFTVTATSNITATVPAPTNPPGQSSRSQEITFEFFNNSGGALTTPIAFNAIYKVSGGVSPGNGLSIEVKFRYNQARNLWIEVARGAAV